MSLNMIPAKFKWKKKTLEQVIQAHQNAGTSSHHREAFSSNALLWVLWVGGPFHEVHNDMPYLLDRFSTPKDKVYLLLQRRRRRPEGEK